MPDQSDNQKVCSEPDRQDRQGEGHDDFGPNTQNGPSLGRGSQVTHFTLPIGKSRRLNAAVLAASIADRCFPYLTQAFAYVIAVTAVLTIPSRLCSPFVLMAHEYDEDPQLYTLGLVERLREDLRTLGAVRNDLHFRIDEALRELANPNLHDVNLVTAFRIELWDRYGRDNLRMIIAATSSIAIAHAAFDAAVTQYADEHLTLRKGAMVLREHGRTKVVEK